MRIAYFSDFQMTHPRGGTALPFVDPRADVAVFAGDIAPPLHRSLQVLAPLAKRMPVVYVAGNRDFYGTEYLGELAAAREIAAEYGIHLLERSGVTLDGVRFAGGTLWTDFALDKDVEASIQVGKAGMTDYRAIRYGDGKLSPQDSLSIHSETRSFLEDEMQAHAGRKVFVTHLAPHVQSVAPQFVGSPLTPCFASDLSDILGSSGAPDIWIHGGLHHCVDYTVGRTRVLSNSLGYSHEQTGFDPVASVDLPILH